MQFVYSKTCARYFVLHVLYHMNNYNQIMNIKLREKFRVVQVTVLGAGEHLKPNIKNGIH